ncbi:MAG: PEP-CTERM sorting domain-containing protein [Phycisphaerae bacterium]|nr:PEP-CTERM sorting domain-containing protein [Phycisphaerae bacterium]
MTRFQWIAVVGSLVMAAVLGDVRPSQAGVILFQDNFDVTANPVGDTSTSVNNDLPARQSGSLIAEPAGSISYYTGWQNWDGIAKVYPTGGSPNGVLRINDYYYSHGVGQGSANYNFINATDIQGGGFIVQYDVMSSGQAAVRLGSNNYTEPWSTGSGLGVILSNGGGMSLFGAGLTSTAISSLPNSSSFHTIRIEVGLTSFAAGANKAIKVYGDNTLLATTSTTAAWGSNYIGLGNRGPIPQGGQSYFDDLTVSNMFVPPVPRVTALPATDEAFFGSTPQLNHAIQLSSSTTSDITVANAGDPGSTVVITGWDITGPDALKFSLRDTDGNSLPEAFSPHITLAAGSSQNFELWFNGADAQGLYGPQVAPDYTMLTIRTSAGNISYYPQATVTVPEPATMAFLALGGLTMVGAGLRRRWRGSN